MSDRFAVVIGDNVKVMVLDSEAAEVLAFAIEYAASIVEDRHGLDHPTATAIRAIIQRLEQTWE